jgi:DNA (cytosine-5)-methyltransferase 1
MVIRIKKAFNTVDLFAGCGGFSQGFQAEGFKILAANEFWEPAIKTYKLNHPKVRMISGDITLSETKTELLKAVSDQKVHVMIGGPPCQGYSSAGNRNPNDPRGQLYLDFFEIIDMLKPDFFVMENVKGLVNMKHVSHDLNQSELEVFIFACNKLQRYKDLKRFKAQRLLSKKELEDYQNLKQELSTIKKEIEKKMIPLIDKIQTKIKEINYRAIWKVLNSADYGVAQTRERVIFIGTRHKEFKLSFPIASYGENLWQKTIDNFSSLQKNIKGEWRSSEEVLRRYELWDENPELNHVFTKHSPQIVNRINKLPVGQNLYKNYNDAWWRLDPSKPAKTVKENHGGVFIHYAQDRVCTPRELAALQSFNDDFIFLGPKSAILKQIGNAIPPLLARVIASEIRKFLEGYYKN